MAGVGEVKDDRTPRCQKAVSWEDGRWARWAGSLAVLSEQGLELAAGGRGAGSGGRGAEAEAILPSGRVRTGNSPGSEGAGPGAALLDPWTD